MAANCYTLLDQSVSPEVLAACDWHGTRVVSAAVFNSGLLASRPSPDAMYDYAQVPRDVFARAVAIERICSTYDVALPGAAMHYPLLDARVVAVAVGAGTPDQVKQNIARLSDDVPDELWAELDTAGLVPRCA